MRPAHDQHTIAVLPVVGKVMHKRFKMLVVGYDGAGKYVKARLFLPIRGNSRKRRKKYRPALRKLRKDLVVGEDRRHAPDLADIITGDDVRM